MKVPNRRELLRSLPLAGATLAVPVSSLVGQEQQIIPEDTVLQEYDLLPFQDGLVFRTADFETALPLFYLGRPVYKLAHRAAEESFPEEEIPIIAPAPVQYSPMRIDVYAPEPDDLTLFEPGYPGEGLIITPSPSVVRAMSEAKGPARASNTSDGQIRKKWDKFLFRFEAHGIIKTDLNPICVPGPVEGIWIKLDLRSFPTAWKTYAEGSLGRIVNQPGQYQFHWNKPNVCGVGANDRQAIYNGIYAMMRKLISDLAGALGRAIDDLVKLSPTVASFLADTLTRWLNSSSGPSSGSGSGTAQQPSTPGTFTLQVSPQSATVRRGNTASFNVSVTSQNGFNSRVSLTASGRTGSTVSFSPSSVNGSGISRLSIRTARTSPVGNHQIIVSASGGGQKKEVPITLSIQ